MTTATKTRYTNKSPGCEKRVASVSRALRYVKRKYGSIIRPNLGPVRTKAVTSRQNCGSCRIVNTCCLMKTSRYMSGTPISHAGTESATAAAVMVLHQHQKLSSEFRLRLPTLQSAAAARTCPSPTSLQPVAFDFFGASSVKYDFARCAKVKSLSWS